MGLKRTLDSFQTCTDKLDELEVLLICDTDDPTLEKVIALTNQYAMSILVMVREKSDFFCRDYYEWAIKKSRGGNIWCFNDDCYILTPHWDTLVKQATINRLIYLVDVWDSTHDDLKWFPRFPIVSRAAIDAVGWLYHPTITMWGADTILYQVYKEAGCVVDCLHVRLQHDHLPSKRFKDAYDKDKANGVFPVPVLNDIENLKRARDGK